MPATIEICESNGAGEAITHGIAQANMGDIDAAQLNKDVYPIVPGARSFAKYSRVHVVAMGGSSRIKDIRVWRTAAPAGLTTHKTNARTSAYGGAKAYATPVKTAITGVDQDMPTSEPAGPNLGIGGDLAGYLGAAGYSDYLVEQLVTDPTDTAGSTTDKNFSYSEIA